MTKNEANNHNYNFDVKQAKKYFKQILEDYNSNNPQKILKAKESAVSFFNNLYYHIAKTYFSNYIPEHLPELIQEGAIGVLKGLKNYNADLGAPSTFFYWYIKHEMQDYINENVLCATEYYSVNIRKIKAAIGEMFMNEQSYSINDIAEKTKLSKKTIQKTLKIMYYRNNIYFEDCNSNIKNIIAQENYIDAENQLIEKETRKSIKKILEKTLDKTEQYVIKNLLGINHQERKLSYNQIGKALNISPSKVKIISATAIDKLRHSELYHLYNNNE